MLNTIKSVLEIYNTWELQQQNFDLNIYEKIQTWFGFRFFLDINKEW